MNKLLIFISFTLIFLSCTKPDSKSESKSFCNNQIAIDTFIFNNYLTDAKDLYLSEIYLDSNHNNYNNPILDTNEINKILTIIQAVYNFRSPLRDTIFYIYKIYSSKCNIAHSISIDGALDAPEIMNLAQGIIPTGLTNLDKILNAYHFNSVNVPSGFPAFTHFFSIMTSEVYNLIPVEKQLKNIPSIIFTQIDNGCSTDGNGIAIKRNGDSSSIKFMLGWGDCPSGCIHKRIWEFKVKCGTAEFIKATQY